jgi:hypothetical protein
MFFVTVCLLDLDDEPSDRGGTHGNIAIEFSEGVSERAVAYFLARSAVSVDREAALSALREEIERDGPADSAAVLRDDSLRREARPGHALGGPPSPGVRSEDEGVDREGP